MAGSTLCITCANLPIKARTVATTVQHCPECNAEVGVTSYGSAFRVRAVKPRAIVTPTLLQGVLVGVGLFAFVMLLVGLGVFSSAQAPPPSRFAAAAKPTAPAPSIFNRVPEVGLINSGRADKDARLLHDLFAEAKAAANPQKRDQFLLGQLEHRPDLRGLPYMMGDACRLNPEDAQSFQSAVRAVRTAIDAQVASASNGIATIGFWRQVGGQEGPTSLNSRSGIAALTQILGPERQDVRSEFVSELALSRHVEAIKTLARMAVFDPSTDVRIAAVKALRERPNDAVTAEIFMHGMRYPMADVAKRTAQAIIALDRKDLVPQLVSLLGEAAPDDPVEAVVDEKPVCTVREVVRVNHHRNCLLCHAPANSGTSEEVPALAPTPGQPFPQTSREYYGDRIILSGPAVRADTTYLRQDFSMLMPVADAAPWPEMQRFDFLVRTRVVEGQELARLQQAVRERVQVEPTAHQEAAARTLRALTGKDAAPTQAAWQRVLGMNE
jgi:hypothetical protein